MNGRDAYSLTRSRPQDLTVWLRPSLALAPFVAWPPFSSPSIVTFYPKDLIMSPVL